MADPSAEHWYPTAAYLYMLHAAAAGQRPPRAGDCACWKIPPWMRATRTRPGSPITMR